MCAVQRDWGAALPEIFDKIIPNHLLHVNSEMLIQRMWRHNPELVLRGLVVTMERKEGAGTQILRLAKLLDIVLPLLVQVPFSQAFELALIADAQGGAELEPWLIGRLAANPSLPQVGCLWWTVKYIQRVCWTFAETSTQATILSSRHCAVQLWCAVVHYRACFSNCTAAVKLKFFIHGGRGSAGELQA